MLLVVGVLLGAIVTLAAQDRRGAADPAGEPGGPGLAAPDVGGATAAAGAGAGAGGRSVVEETRALPLDPATDPPTQQVLLAWSTDALPADAGAALAGVAGIEQVTAVRHATVDLVAARGATGAVGPDAGFSIPIDTIAVDPAGYPSFVPPDRAATFARLGATDAILSRTGAALRGVHVGGELTFAVAATAGAVDGSEQTLTVVAVVDDAVIGGAELAVGVDAGDALGITQDRYLLIAHLGDRATIEDAVRAAVASPVRFRGPGETPFLRDGDAVLPQALVKASFGEFAVRRGSLDQEPSWPPAHLVDVELPVLGAVRCHRAVVEDLRAAMDQIERDNLAYLIDGAVACWYADRIERTGAVSRGLWGIAVVLDPARNPTGATSAQDPRVVAIMQANGFTWGGDFLVPEPAYFEHVGSSAGPSAR